MPFGKLSIMYLQIDDLKVFSANAICAVLLNISNMNPNLQSVLFLATIVYTLVRTVNEVQKFKDRKKSNSDHEEIP
jgi:large-conductance mechanosensitive channel